MPANLQGANCNKNALHINNQSYKQLVSEGFEPRLEAQLVSEGFEPRIEAGE